MSLPLEAAKRLDEVLHRCGLINQKRCPIFVRVLGLPADEGFINLENADQLGNFLDRQRGYKVSPTKNG